MKLKHLYISGLAIMLIMNGILIFILLQQQTPTHGPGQGQPPRPGNEQGLGRKIQTELEFSPEQMRQFDTLAREHHQAMQKINRQQKELATSYFNLLRESDSDVDEQLQVLELLKEIEAQKFQITFAHFLDIKELCTPEQREQFDLLVDDMLLVLLGNENNRRPPPPRFGGF